MLAYKQIIEELQTALEMSDIVLKDCLHDLLFLFDFAIPLVSNLNLFYFFIINDEKKRRIVVLKHFLLVAKVMGPCFFHH